LTLHDTLTEARSRLIAAGIPPSDAGADVNVLAQHVLGWDRVRLLAEQRGDVPGEFASRLSELIERRIRREPTAYIVGRREFWGLDLLVTPAVLIPRPESEFIVEEAIPLLEGNPQPHLADIGTGSGCLAVALAYELRGAHVIASDLSPEALAVARQNATRVGVQDRVMFVRTSYLDGVEGPYDLVVANPPYVREADKDGLSRDVRHEPGVALFGGGDGLRDVAGVLDAAVRTVKPGGWLVMEFGYGQEGDVRALVTSRPALRFERVRHDLQGIARTAIIRRL
jgi:release factor glutamine methyltransferase